MSEGSEINNIENDADGYTFEQKFNFLYNFYKIYSPVILEKKSQEKELDKLKFENNLLKKRIKFQ